jgi:hypothetical protein
MRSSVKLELRGGLSVRYEGYTNAILDDDMGTADPVGRPVYLQRQFPGARLRPEALLEVRGLGRSEQHSLTYNPSFDDFGNYRLDHLTAVDVPLGTADYWKLRFSLANQYNSVVPEGTEELDTTYALSLLLNWK